MGFRPAGFTTAPPPVLPLEVRTHVPNSATCHNSRRHRVEARRSQGLPGRPWIGANPRKCLPQILFGRTTKRPTWMSLRHSRCSFNPARRRHCMIDKYKTKLCLTFFLSGSVTTILLFVLIVGFARYRERNHWTARAEVQAGQRAVPPCGLIEAQEIPLPFPEGVVPDGSERLQPPKWTFPGFSNGRLVHFLSSCDLRPAQRRILLNPKYCNVTSNGCVITPPATLIWSLNSRAREQIYSALGRSQNNYAQQFPLRFSPDGFEERLTQSGHRLLHRPGSRSKSPGARPLQRPARSLLRSSGVQVAFAGHTRFGH